METAHQHPVINSILAAILFIVGYMAKFYKTHIDSFEFIGWVIQSLAWLGAFLAGTAAFLGLLHNHGWINIKKKKKR